MEEDFQGIIIIINLYSLTFVPFKYNNFTLNVFRLHLEGKLITPGKLISGLLSWRTCPQRGLL